MCVIRQVIPSKLKAHQDKENIRNEPILIEQTMKLIQ